MADGRIYEVAWDAATAITAQIDIFELAPADDKPVYIHELRIWQTTDFGDAQEEILGITLFRGFTSSGSGGGTSTIVPKNTADAAAGFTSECRNTSLATTGTNVKVFGDGWNVRVPYIWTPTPRSQPSVTQANTTLVVRLDAAPADSLTMNACMTVEELG